MFNGKRLIAIVDIDSIVDESGDRYKIVSHGTKLIANIDFAGVQTMQLGQSQGVNLSYSVEIPRLQYNYEKYCFFDNQLYEIVNTTKAREHTNMLLNVAKLDDNEIEQVIREWLGGSSNANC